MSHKFPKPTVPSSSSSARFPSPVANTVRVAVDACGVCHSDVLTKIAAFPGMSLPRVPGHEVIGRVDALGPGVEGWTIGQRVGVGWHGGYCGKCDPCRRGKFFACVTGPPITGHLARRRLRRVHDRAGHVARARARRLSATDAAPLMCAGVTTFNALRNSGARSGDLVAVHGLGGLGHLGVQFAAKMGFHTVAVARGADKAQLALSLGADRYIDSTVEDPAKALAAMGGARVVLATVTDAEAMSAMIGGLGIEGALLVLGAPPTPLAAPAFPADRRASERRRVVFRRLDRLRGYARLQRANGRALDERSDAAREGRAGPTTA